MRIRHTVALRWIPENRRWYLDCDREFLDFVKGTDWEPVGGFWYEIYFPVGLFLDFCRRNKVSVRLIQEN